MLRFPDNIPEVRPKEGINRLVRKTLTIKDSIIINIQQNEKD